MDAPSSPTEGVKWVNWTPPEPYWYKLNTGGASKGNPGLSGSGGLIPDCRGCWVSGFVRNLGVTDAVQAELYAIKIGLQLAWDLGIRLLILESDSDVALRMITDKGQLEHQDSNTFLVSQIQEQLSRKWIVQVQHVYREGNSCADYLTNIGVSTFLCRVNVIYTLPPQEMFHLLQEDAFRVAKPRFPKFNRKIKGSSSKLMKMNNPCPPRLIQC